MPKGYPNKKETMSDIMARFMAPIEPMTEAEMAAERPKLRAAYQEFKKRKKVRA